MKQEQSIADAERVRQLLLAWATAIRTGAQHAILQGHDPDILVYDVLPPCSTGERRLSRELEQLAAADAG